jgi:hypothetical protein
LSLFALAACLGAAQLHFGLVPTIRRRFVRSASGPTAWGDDSCETHYRERDHPTLLITLLLKSGALRRQAKGKL